MSNVITTAGATFGIVAETPETFDTEDVTGYPSLTYTTVGEITDFGEFGAVYEVVTHNPVGSRNTIKRKGTKNYGQISLVLGRDRGDAGQVILQEGADGDEVDTTHSFKITLQNGDIIYASGQVYSFTDNMGSVNNIVQIGCTLELDDITDAPAA